MIESKKDLREYIDYEKRLYGKKRPILFRPVLSVSSIAWKYVSLLRYEEYHHNVHHRLRALLYRYLRLRLGRRQHLEMAINTIDKGLLLHHPHNIVIYAKKVGKDFSIQFNCSLVAGGHDEGCPSIGDFVTMGVSSMVVGDVYIADGIAIGANSMVNKSFEEKNICIAGSPAKKISDNGSATWAGQQKRLFVGAGNDDALAAGSESEENQETK